MASGPLDGIRVLEFTQIIAGPFGCQNLADMGAEVVKVEPPEGEPWRIFGQFMPGETKYFQSLNRGKKSLVLRLQEPDAQKIVHDLIPSFDVVVINYRPDVPVRLGIDYETLSALRPDLIYVDNTAFGREGPWAHRPGYDVVVQGVSGLMAGEGKVDEHGQPQIISSTAIADYATGLAIAWGVSAALFHRERTGEGQLIESTLLATAMAFQGSVVMELPVADAAMRNPIRDRIGEMREQGVPYDELLKAHDPRAQFSGNTFYRAFRTKDGAVAVGALSAGLREKLRTAFDSDWKAMDDPEYNPMDPEWNERGVKAVAEVEELVASKTTDEWMDIFDREGVPAGPVVFPEDLASHPQIVANDMMVDLDHDLSGPQQQVGPVLKFSNAPLAAQGSSPPLGRDTDEIVRSAGYSDEQIADLRERGVIA